MEYFAGLDVAMEETSICVIDQDGKVVLETSVASDPDAIFAVLKNYLRSLRRVGHEAGSLSPWLQVEFKQRGLPAIRVDAWHARAALSAMRNKTDKADARGLHIACAPAGSGRSMSRARRAIGCGFCSPSGAISSANSSTSRTRHSIKTFGLKVGKVSRGRFQARVREPVARMR